MPQKKTTDSEIDRAYLKQLLTFYEGCERFFGNIVLKDIDKRIVKIADGQMKRYARCKESLKGFLERI